MKDRVTLDTVMKDLLEKYPKVKDLLWNYGLCKLEEDDIAPVVLDKLTLKGFMRLMDIDEDTQGDLWMQIQDLIKESEV
ncbi:hypothetical protein Thal_0977 [Thermocrinis albus DSM 14484]|uniref:DUF1858 domain-containing protein n=1 Tax=Thermocrinis albus (strain DSM 14484 / JCM 11386 / HI 11/12) TaxID=638303 RepID=D3SLH9_THEAH|nr:DUF1858 domain-containing protein [Thermocrinis albus]ADC89609.1 hypothetical protein Thal_0977 [Thermocrinis albus DSM 14484]